MLVNRTNGIGVAGWVVLVLLANPLLYHYHLVDEPHVFCPVHMRLESRMDPDTGEPFPGVPADPDTHDEADASCLLVQTMGASEHTRGMELPPVILTDDQPPVTRGRVEGSVFQVLDLAPKHSPPLAGVSKVS